MKARILGLAYLILVLLILPAPYSWAGEGIDLNTGEPDDAGNVDSGLSTGDDDSRPTPSPVSDNNPSGDPWVGLPTAGVTDDGDPCIDYRYVQLPNDEIQSAIFDAWASLRYMFSNVPELQGLLPDEDCPSDPGDDLPAPMVREAVRETVTDVLPRPRLSVPPGYALTGMPAYLVTDHALEYGPVDHPVDLGMMNLAVRVEGTGTSTVDWGDGSEPQTYDQPGLPYPDGGIKYTYADRGNVTITVTDSWRLTFNVYRDGNVIISDVVEFELNPVALEEPLEVREFRSVRTSSQ